MLELLGIYSWTILAGVIASAALSVLGIQLATRDRAMQTLCVGQGAMVGVLFGIGLLMSFEGSLVLAVGPLSIALVFSFLTVILTDKLVAKKAASKNTVFAFVFASLLASGYLISSLFPALESHMAQVYFGDLATLTVFDSKATVVVSALCLGFLLFHQLAVSNESFEWAIFGTTYTRKNEATSRVGFRIVMLLLLCLSVQYVGFLFTISMLFIPTALMGYLVTKGLRVHVILSVVLSVVSTVIGFLLSLKYTRLPTVPAIVAVLFLTGLVTLTVDWVVNGFMKRRRLTWKNEVVFADA